MAKNKKPVKRKKTPSVSKEVKKTPEEALAMKKLEAFSLAFTMTSDLNEKLDLAKAYLEEYTDSSTLISEMRKQMDNYSNVSEDKKDEAFLGTIDYLTNQLLPGLFMVGFDAGTYTQFRVGQAQYMKTVNKAINFKEEEK